MCEGSRESSKHRATLLEKISILVEIKDPVAVGFYKAMPEGLRPVYAEVLLTGAAYLASQKDFTSESNSNLSPLPFLGVTISVLHNNYMPQRPQSLCKREDSGSRKTSKPCHMSKMWTSRHQTGSHEKCGKPNCSKCPHGPYWYVAHRIGEKMTDCYIGKTWPEAQQ